MERIVGRERELHELELSYRSQRSELVILFGRRRVGKTFLVRSFFNDQYTFHFVGAHRKPQTEQLENFRKALLRYGLKEVPVLDNWTQAFDQLSSLIEQSKDERKVIFIDEMPWIDSKRSDFITSFEYFWNSWVSGRDDIMLIACGSATSWMREKLEENQGGLHNRKTRCIYLPPFSLHECREYLVAHEVDWDEYQIIQCYMTMGGVPYYLSLIEPQLSLQENIDNLFFRRNAQLRDEFAELYPSLFRNADRYISIIRLLSKRREGYTLAEIEQHTGFSGGSLSKTLRNLECCDFINVYTQYGNKSKKTIYRLCDFYTLFYIRFVEPDTSHDEQYWAHHHTDKAVSAWEGFSFEQVCFAHLPQLKRALGISGMATNASSWRYVAPKNADTEGTDLKKGTQIDLVISRADKIVHLCEMKFSETPYTITSDYAAKLRSRKSIFCEETKTRHGAVITFVTPYGIAPGKNSGIVHSQIVAEDLFAPT